MREKVAIVIAVALLAATDASPQATTTLMPALSVSTVHDDNVFSRPQGTADILTSLQPSLEGQLRSPTVNLQSLISFDMQRSARGTTPTTLAARRHAMFDGRVRSTPSVLLGVTGRYDRTETASDLSIDAGILLPRQRAQSLQATPSVAFRVTPLTTITTQYDWTHQSLSGSPGSDLHVAHAWTRSPILSAHHVERRVSRASIRRRSGRAPIARRPARVGARVGVRDEALAAGGTPSDLVRRRHSGSAGGVHPTHVADAIPG